MKYGRGPVDAATKASRCAQAVPSMDRAGPPRGATTRALAAPATRVTRVTMRNPHSKNAPITPNGIRTRVTALKGRGPRPLADGGAAGG